jgi:class 3 adenylate cyclase/CHASE2 domain-containing sensor protein
MARIRRRDAWLVAPIVLVCCLLASLPLVDGWRGLSLDLLTALRWQAFGARHDPAQSPVVVVAIDEETHATAPFKGSPTVTWTREIGRVVTALVDGGAAVVGFDIVFPSSIEQSELPFGDEPVGVRLRGFDRDFLRALHAAAGTGQLVLGEVQHRDQPIRPAPGQRIAVGQQANVRALNAYNDADDVLRRMPLGFIAEGEWVPSMAVELAARAQGVRPQRAADGQLTLAGYRVPAAVPNTLTLNFDGGAGARSTYSLADLRACAVLGDQAYFRRHFAGKVVLLGTLLDTDDRKATSKRFATGLEHAGAPRCVLPQQAAPGQVQRRTISGVYLHATAVDNLIRRDAVTEWARPAALAIAAVLAGLAATAALLLSPAAAALLSAGLVAAYVAAAVVAFRDALALPLVEPLLATMLALAATIAYRLMLADHEERFLRKSFALYLSPEVIDQMLESDRLPVLGGEMREVTVFFSDIVGFSTIAEAISPQALVGLMNHYLSEMTDIIEAAGGYVDKYIGDSIVAVFGAPLDDPDHARHAVDAALGCQARLAEMNRGAEAFLGRQVAHRIGINSGQALVGNIGSRRRFNYTVMSDAVNLASRLEGANKYVGTSILVSEMTVAATGQAFAWREIDAIRVKGRVQPVSVYEPLALAGRETTGQAACRLAYAEGLAAWRARAFAQAADCFARCAAIDPPARLFEQRARASVEQPPGPDWEPVNTLGGK